MNESSITVRYAKAIFQAANESEKLDLIRNDINLIKECISSSEEFQDFLENPILKESSKINIINQIFKKQIDDLSYNFLILLIKNKREHFLPGICRYFITLDKKQTGYKETVITTAQPFDKGYFNELRKYIEKKLKLSIDLKEQVEESIIGGFKLRIEDQLIDASLSSNLLKIKRELINS